MLSQTQSVNEEMKLEVDEMHVKLDEVNNKYFSLEAEKNSIQEKYQAIKAERNNLKQKTESLVKEMSRIRKTGLEISDIERIMQENSDLRAEVETLKAQKLRLAEELATEQVPSNQEVENSSETNTVAIAASPEELHRALEQKAELERMVKELTEYVDAKQSQLDTMKDVNRQLTEELQNAARSRRMPLKPFFDKDAKAVADADSKTAKSLLTQQNQAEALTKVVEERDSLKNELVCCT